jgi:hypothetical protein
LSNIDYPRPSLIKGIRVGIHAPWVSHLLFGDDCLVFTQASAMGATRLNAILETYQKGSGQMVNKNKSAILFSRNCEDDMKIIVHAALGISSEAKIEKYLGLPTVRTICLLYYQGAKGHNI